MLTFSQEDITQRNLPEPCVYWSAREAATDALDRPFKGTRADALFELEAIGAGVVASRLMSDVPLGAMLSGGVDSAVIASLAQRAFTAKLKTFTIGFDDPTYDETEDALQVAQAIGSSHTTVTLSERDALDLIPRVFDAYDEPFADSSQIPTLMVSQTLRNNVSVALSGDGGDELFGGYVRHRMGPRLWRQISAVPAPIRRAMRSTRDALGGSARIGGAFASISRSGGEGAERIVKGLELIDANDPDEVYDRLVRYWQRGRSPLGGPERSASRNESARDFDISRQYMLNDTIGYMPNDVLVKTDRASMAVSLEVRAPFLSPDFFRFAWSLPTEWLVGPAGTKLLLREFASRLLPNVNWTRPKRGFAIPLDRWLRGPLRQWAEDTLAPKNLERTNLPFDVQILRRTWEEHKGGAASHASRLWPTLALVSWINR
jgi:asparagine synthase (glutamine-hydrolysing)